MPAPSAAEQQAAYAALSRLSEKDLRTVWARLNLGDAKRLVMPLAEILAGLVGRYGTAAAALAADWFDEARMDAGASGSFRAIAAGLPDAAKLESTAGWGVSPLFGANPDGGASLALLIGGLQRMVTGMGRRTTEMSAARDPQIVGYARHASANACAFCRMLATRGPAYGSEESAGRVTGVHLGGKDYRKMREHGVSESSITAGRKSRAGLSRSIGDKYHDHCHCVPVPVWSNADYQPAPYVADWEADYAAARRQAGSSDPSQILSKMREISGAR